MKDGDATPQGSGMGRPDENKASDQEQDIKDPYGQESSSSSQSVSDDIKSAASFVSDAASADDEGDGSAEKQQ